MSEPAKKDGEKPSSLGRTIGVIILIFILIQLNVISMLAQQLALLFAVMRQNAGVLLTIAGVALLIGAIRNKKKGGGDPPAGH